MENNKIKLKDTQIESSQIIDKSRETEGIHFPSIISSSERPICGIITRDTHRESSFQRGLEKELLLLLLI